MLKTRVARKENQCAVCNKPILKGKPFVLKPVFGGGFLYTVHQECSGQPDEVTKKNERGVIDEVIRILPR